MTQESSPLQPKPLEDYGLKVDHSFSYEHEYGSFTCEMNCSGSFRHELLEYPSSLWLAVYLNGIAVLCILYKILRTANRPMNEVSSKVLKVQGRRCSRSWTSTPGTRHQAVFFLWLLTFHYVEGHWREIVIQKHLKQMYEDDNPHLFLLRDETKANDQSRFLQTDWGFDGSWISRFVWTTSLHSRPPDASEPFAHLYDFENVGRDLNRDAEDELALFQSHLQFSPVFEREIHPLQDPVEWEPTQIWTTGASILPRIHTLLRPIWLGRPFQLWSVYALDGRGTEIFALKSQSWPPPSSIDAIFSLFNGIEFWYLGDHRQLSLQLCSAVIQDHLHLVLHFPSEFEVPIIGRIIRPHFIGRFFEASSVANPVTKDSLLQAFDLLDKCDQAWIRCVVESGGVTFTRLLGHDISDFLHACAVVDVTVLMETCQAENKSASSSRGLADETSWMQGITRHRKILQLWGFTWSARFQLHRHTWSHLEGSSLSTFHLPDSTQISYTLTEIQGKEGKQFIAHDPRIELPIFLEISCISSEHRGILSWTHQRATTAYSFVWALCSTNDVNRDWTCWAQKPDADYIPGAVDIPVVPGSFVKIWQRERAPEDSDLSSSVPSTPSGSIIQDLPEVEDQDEEDPDYCTLFQRTFVGSLHEGLDWAERDIPRGDWANHMEQNFLADVQYIRQQIVPQPGLKFIRITRLHVNPTWPLGTLSWEVNQASPLRIMREIQEHWPDVQADWRLHALDTSSSALYALEELILILELPSHDWDADRRLPHLFERIAVQGSTIKANAIAKILESPTTKRDIILLADMVGCTHNYACEVWLHGKRLLTSDQIWLHVPTLIQVVRTLGGEDMPLLTSSEELSIPSGAIRFWPSPYYSVLRHYGHPWKVMIFRDSSRAVPPDFELMLQTFHQPETLTALSLQTWPTLRITDWRTLSVDDNAYSSEALRDFDAIYLIAELHTEASWCLVLLERLIETSSFNEIQVVAHRMLTPIGRDDLIFSLDAEQLCRQPNKHCQTDCNGQPLIEGGRHQAADGDFCRLHITSIPEAVCSGGSSIITENPSGARDRSRSPLKRYHSKTTYPSTTEQGPHFSSTRHRTHGSNFPMLYSDHTSLMQLATPMMTLVPPITYPSWFYVFTFGGTEPRRLRGDAQGTLDQETFIREELLDHAPPTPSIELMVRKVLPQPVDLVEQSISAFVAVRFSELGPYLMPILLDIWWVSHLRESPQQPLTLWRQTKLVQYRTERSAFFDKVGLNMPCNIVPEACRISHRGFPWPPNTYEIRRFTEGDLVEVWFPHLSIEGQWRCLQEGCELRDFPQHIRHNAHEHFTPLNNTEEEHTSFMQHSTSSRSFWFYAYQSGTDDPFAFSLSSQEMHSPLPAVEARLRGRLNHWVSSPGSLALVTPLPTDLLRDGIMAAVIHEGSVPAGHSTVLVDVDFLDAAWNLRDSSVAIMDGWRETIVLPSLITRSQFLTQMDLREICNDPDKVCSIIVRGIPWPPDDPQNMALLNGDFILIQVGPAHGDPHCTQEEEVSAPVIMSSSHDIESGHEYLADDSQSMLQTFAHAFTNRSHSALGWSRLPPPGNGNQFVERFRQACFGETNPFLGAMAMSRKPQTKKVSFNPVAEVHEFDVEDYDEEPKLWGPEKRATVTNSFIRKCFCEIDHPTNRFLANCQQRCLHLDLQTTNGIWTPTGFMRGTHGSELLQTLPEEYSLHKAWIQQSWQLYVWDQTSAVLPVFYLAQDTLRCQYVARYSRFDEIADDIDWAEKASFETHSAGQFLGAFSFRRCDSPSTSIAFQQVLEAASHVLSLPLPTVDTAQIEWHASTSLAFTEVPPWDLKQGICAQYAFYTDGSTGQLNHGAAAVVALGWWKGRWFWLGAIAVADPNHKKSGRMETLAVQLALTWALHLVHRHRLCAAPAPKIQFGFDSMVAGYTATGIWSANTNLDLHAWNRALVYWLQALLPPLYISWMHVYSHQGHAWNEAADTIASLAASGDLLTGSIDTWERLIDSSHWEQPLQWVWTLEDSHFRPLFRWIDGKFHLCIPLPSKTHPDAPPHPFERLSSHGGSSSRNVLICRVASANVLTLFPDKEGEPWTGSFASARMESLLTMFQRREYLMVGVQESRMKYDGHKDLEDWHLLSGSATPKGHGGTQLWVFKHWPTSNGFVKIEAAHMRILFADSHLLLVRFTPPGLKLLVIVGHAPAAASDQEACTFWRKVTRCIPSSYKSWNWISFFDANARLGSLPSDQVGPLDAEHENPAGRWFHEWLHTHSMMLPATFGKYHSGQSWTWVHSNGVSKSRLDYIGVSAELSLNVIQTFIEPDVDLSIARTDHMATAMTLTLSMEDQQPAVVPRRSYDTVQLQARIQEDILAGSDQHWIKPIQKVDWDVDVHDHAAILEDGTQKVLRWFPTETRTPRKKHLTEPTWQLISAKKQLWKALCTTQRAYKRDLLYVLFRAWRKQPTVQVESLSWLCWREAFLMYHYRRLCRMVTSEVRKDDTRFYEELAQRAGDADGNNHNSSLWKAIKMVLPKQIRRRQNSTSCQTPSASDLHQHFDQLEAGEKIDYPSLLSICRAGQEEAKHEIPLQFELADLPTRLEVEKLCKKVHTQKSPGIDGIPQVWIKLGGPIVAVPLHALMLKCWIAGQEPLQFKGGLLHPLWKKGAKADAGNYRGITLLETYGKRWHALLRARLLKCARTIRTTGQLGGFPAQQTGFASLYLRSFTSLTNWQRYSEAVIFFDIKGAFHHLLRELAFDPTKEFPPFLADILAAEGIPWETLHSQVRYDDLDWLSSDIGLHRAICDAHSFTWTHFKDDPASLRRTHRGTRPGSPLADLAFNCLMSRVLFKIQEALDQDEDLQKFSTLTGFSLYTLAWVDDIAIPLAYSDNDVLLERVRHYTLLVKKIMLSLGFLLNMGKGKTEAVLTFRGRGAPRKRREIYLQQDATLQLDADSALHIVSDYKHLGARFSQHAKFDREITVRIAEAQAAFRELRRSIFTNRRISIASRLRLLESLVLSKLLFNSGFWPELRPTQLQRLDSCIIKWQRIITGDGFWGSHKVSNLMFLKLHELPSIEARLNRNRLLCAFQVIGNSPDLAWPAVVCAERAPSVTWLTLVRRAIEWLQDIDPGIGPLSPSSCSITHLEHWLHNSSHSGPGA